ncbi:MAG: hypothetical protein K0R15_611 [Clostridiales bacterium]|nr:hypothetical protein [Clostridiales bacterium]
MRINSFFRYFLDDKKIRIPESSTNSETLVNTNAGGGTRTHTSVNSSDFESDASAIPPHLRKNDYIIW